MIFKQYLPFRFSRDGWIPNRLRLHFVKGSAQAWETELNHIKKTAHYYMAKDGTVTALTPLSAAATYLGSLAKGEDSPGKQGILVLIEGEECSKEQQESLLRLLKRIQQEVLRIYGEPFPFCRERITADGTLPLEELLEEGYVVPEDQTLYRVQTGTYRTKDLAEDSIERLQKAGIAAYITEVKYQ